MQRKPPAKDCHYAGYDAASDSFAVHEQLYPIGRGYLAYHFASEVEAREWLASLPDRKLPPPAPDDAPLPGRTPAPAKK